MYKKIIKNLSKWRKEVFNFDDTKYIYVLAGAVFLAGILLIVWFAFQVLFSSKSADLPNDNLAPDNKKVEEKKCDYRRKLDGVCVDSAGQTDPKLVMVMIENNAEAWPLSGLADARVVYEAPVEGNIPRFMAIYIADTEAEQAGPVRSARPYYLDWASEYGNAMYMHVGGSPDALDLLEAYDLFDVNEFTKGWYFWRDEKRSAPHNAYTSDELWNKAYDDYGEYEKQEDYDGWTFAEMEACENGCVEEIEISFSSWRSYSAVWKYNTTTQEYVRFQGAEQDFDIDGAAITADTVVVQRVRAKVVDDIGRKQIDTIGSDDAVIFRDGRAIEGQWFKESRKDRTQWYDANGEIISLRAGKIWIEVLPDNIELKW